MIRKLLMTTAITLIATSGGMAQDNNEAAPADQMEQFLQEQGQSELATDMIGHSVYTSEADDAELIGDINDLVIAEDGTIEAVVIGVGGFLGVGEKKVAVSYDSIQWVQAESGEQFAVFEASKESLEAAPEFVAEEEQAAMAPAEQPAEGEDITAAPAEGEETAEAPAEQPAEDEEMAEAPAEQPAEGEEMAAAPAEQPAEGEDMAAGEQTEQPVLSDVEAGSISAEQLIGATVYAASEDQSVGDVGDVRLSADGGEVDALIVDVGGFLGIGEKPVAIGFQHLRIQKDESDTFYVYTDFTRDELDAAPDYDEATYDEQRDTMRLTMEK
jgi:sporulation protein YlmC with PRC-barrel domain